MAAAQKKFNHESETTPSPSPERRSLHEQDDEFYEQSIQDTRDKWRADSAELRKRAARLVTHADKLERLANNISTEDPIEQASGSASQSSPRISDWSKTSFADALHEYMRQFPKGQRLKAANVIADLTKGGVNCAENLRLGDTNYQKESERNLFITASRNEDKYGRDISKNAREIWRI